MFVYYDATGLGRGFAGGVIIALSTTLLMLLLGETAGISSILSALTRPATLLRWRGAFLGGLLIAGAILTAVPNPADIYGPTPTIHWAAALCGGLSVGLGSKMGNGCTSGHGVVGLARLSPRSLTAVLCFMGAAIITAGLCRAPFSVIYSGSSTPGWALSPQLFIVPLVVTIFFLLLKVAATMRLSRGEKASAAARSELLTSSPSGVSQDEAAAAPAAPVTWGAFWGAQAAALVCGLIFGLGLGVSGMTDPSKVLRFLDFLGAGGWDPQLMLVMGGGVAVNAVTWRVMAVGALSKFIPPFAAAVAENEAGRTGAAEKTLGSIIAYGPSCAANKVVDGKLLSGAVLFGVGWGITGVCPGPGIVDYVSGGSHFGVVVPAIIAGMGVFDVAFGADTRPRK